MWFLEKTGQPRRQLGTGTDQFVHVANDLTITNNTLILNRTRAEQAWKLSCEAVSFGTNIVEASNPKELNILCKFRN